MNDKHFTISHESAIRQDMNAEVALLTVSGVSAMIGGAIGHPDMASVAGAMLAAAIALMEAVDKNRSLAQRIKIVLGTGGIGAAAPNAALWFCKVQGWANLDATSIPWHVWGLAGFLSGAIGWVLVWAAIELASARSESIVKKAADKLLPKWMTESKSGDKTKKQR